MKFVACDVDGTLLPHGEKVVSENIFRLIREIADKNIIFAIASGRPYHDLKRLFAGLEDRVYFLPSDGAAVIHGEKTYYKKPVQPFGIREIVNPIVNTEKQVSVVLAGKYISYVISKDGGFVEKIRQDTGGHIMEIDSFDEVSEEIFEVSLYGEPKSAFAKQIMSGRGSHMAELIYKDHGWTEFVAKGVGKHEALGCMMKNLKISPEELAVAGDGENDLGMLALTKKSIATPIAAEKIKKAAGAVMDIEEFLSNIVRKGDI